MATNEEIINYFKPQGLFTTSDIASWFHDTEPDLKASTINWRVYELVKEGVITRVSKGVFKIGDANAYTPILDLKIKRLAKTISKQFPYAEFCIWDSAMTNTFSQHLVSNSFYMVAVEKDAAESVFHSLQERMKNVYYNPTDYVIDNYLYQNDAKPIVVKNLISESPTETVDGIKVPSLEMILVDIFCDKRLFKAFQGNEMVHIYQNVFNQFTINMTKMLRYAARRGKCDEIKQFLEQINVNY